MNENAIQQYYATLSIMLSRLQSLKLEDNNWDSIIAILGSPQLRFHETNDGKGVELSFKIDGLESCIDESLGGWRSWDQYDAMSGLDLRFFFIKEVYDLQKSLYSDAHSLLSFIGFVFDEAGNDEATYGVVPARPGLKRSYGPFFRLYGHNRRQGWEWNDRLFDNIIGDEYDPDGWRIQPDPDEIIIRYCISILSTRMKSLRKRFPSWMLCHYLTSSSDKVVCPVFSAKIPIAVKILSQSYDGWMLFRVRFPCCGDELFTMGCLIKEHHCYFHPEFVWLYLVEVYDKHSADYRWKVGHTIKDIGTYLKSRYNTRRYRLEKTLYTHQLPWMSNPEIALLRSLNISPIAGKEWVRQSEPKLVEWLCLSEASKYHFM